MSQISWNFKVLIRKLKTCRQTNLFRFSTQMRSKVNSFDCWNNQFLFVWLRRCLEKWLFHYREKSRQSWFSLKQVPFRNAWWIYNTFMWDRGDWLIDKADGQGFLCRCLIRSETFVRPTLNALSLIIMIWSSSVSFSFQLDCR